MNDDHFDGLVNDATHAVTNLIPDTVLDGLRDRERSDLLFQINDALTPILRDVIDRTDTDNPTRASTVAALISELLETHAQKCDEGGDCEDFRVAGGSCLGLDQHEARLSHPVCHHGRRVALVERPRRNDRQCTWLAPSRR